MEYNPNYFKIESKTKCQQIIKENSFAVINYLNNGLIEASHNPVMFNEDYSKLLGHFSKANPIWKTIDNQSILLVFNGPHCYVAPEWYGTQNNVPTWNYVVVHVRGTIKMIHDSTQKIKILKNMSDKYRLPEFYKNKQEISKPNLSQIVAFEVKITSIEGKAKLNQNKSASEVKGVIEALENNEITNSNQKMIAMMNSNLISSSKA